MPRWAQSIRFRLSLAYALAVFAAGSVLLSTLLVWQTSRLDEPVMVEGERLLGTDPRTGEFRTIALRVERDELLTAYMAKLEQDAYARSLDELRKASLVGLGALFLVAFGSGWLLAGWTLRPMGRMAAVARDISGTELSRRIGLRGPEDELKYLADTFDAMLDRLQASFEDQRRFVQDASHELRNPLAVAQTNLELVIDDPDADVDELRRAAGIAHTSNERLGRIVDELLDQARRGVPAATVVEVDLRALASGIVEELRASADARDVTLFVVDDAAPVVGSSAGDGATTTGVRVKGDEAAIRRAITNLVVNAIRLAPERSTVRLDVSSERGMAVVSVIDEGPGIAAENQEAVFERFWRGDDAGQGLGLGLSIVRQVAKRHGGDVTLTSAPGSGSTFSIRLPMPVPTG